MGEDETGSPTSEVMMSWDGEDDDRIRVAELSLTRAQTELSAIEAAPTQTQLTRETKARNRGFRVFAAVIVLVMLGGYLFTYTVSQQVGAQSARQEILESAVHSLEETNQQRQLVGLAPVDIPAVVEGVETSGMNQSALVDAVTLNVVARLETDPRFRGAGGATGPIGPRGEPCLPANPECKGPKGDKGEPGEPAPTIDAANFQEIDGECQVVLRLSNGKDIIGDAGEAACADQG